MKTQQNRLTKGHVGTMRLLILGCLVGALGQGCMSTLRVQQLVHKESYPSYEMSTKSGLFQGAYLGIVNKTGRESTSQKMVPRVIFYHYQFAGVLVGPVPRFLQLYIPIPPDNRYVGIMEETKTPIDARGKEVAFFVVGDIKRVLGERDVESALEKKYGISPSVWGKQPILIEWRGDENPEASVTCYADNATGLRQSITEDRLDRIQRSRLRPIFAPVLYLISVPFDIVTFPVQAVIWLHQGGPG